MNYYLVRNGEAVEVDHDDLNRYPYMVDDAAHDAEEQYSDDWHLYETSGTEWCIAYAADEAGAIALADRYDRGEVEHVNVWCEICGHAHGAVSSPDRGGRRDGAGRKPVIPALRKEQSKARISAWVLDWLDAHKGDGSRGELLEAALIKAHKLKPPTAAR